MQRATPISPSPTRGFFPSIFGIFLCDYLRATEDSFRPDHEFWLRRQRRNQDAIVPKANSVSLRRPPRPRGPCRRYGQCDRTHQRGHDPRIVLSCNSRWRLLADRDRTTVFRDVFRGSPDVLRGLRRKPHRTVAGPRDRRTRTRRGCGYLKPDAGDRQFPSGPRAAMPTPVLAGGAVGQDRDRDGRPFESGGGDRPSVPIMSSRADRSAPIRVGQTGRSPASPTLPRHLTALPARRRGGARRTGSSPSKAPSPLRRVAG